MNSIENLNQMRERISKLNVSKKDQKTKDLTLRIIDDTLKIIKNKNRN